ncbi:uncharacterized protein LACBIDRAFT_309853 [Laccaria bicolor S238N-H82]|uniref:Predicted protein n=1 Tax=Laccaria bicolor (strain S238N-H82 / ATCC MYA-4686) TaxID=486041 RepID=B0DT70_LACBS|nr:uncharacterized protein LACBIDRAFT_309853 [Laccaria bicolor S238N-H82]EDR02168.1 predicted protein [Laccaria bicolor S238N-H82]|eukprot:XP_001887113.1 predicted protein [Laccaria bicolor S238N-H82]
MVMDELELSRRTGRGSRVETTEVGRLSTSPKPRQSLLHQDLTSPLLESAREREVDKLKNVERKAGYD